MAPRFITQYYPGVATLEGATDIVLGLNQQLTDINAQMQPYSRIQGLVTNPQGEPLANIDCRLWRQVITNGQRSWIEMPQTFTVAEGTYAFLEVTAGTYRLGFFPPVSDPYTTEYYNDVTDFAMATELVVATGEYLTAINAQLDLRSHITGRVNNPAGEPLSDIGVQAYRWTTEGQAANTWVGAGSSSTTDSNGNYDVSGLDVGLYRLQFTEDGSRNLYLDEFYDNAYSVALATTITVPRSSTVANINITLTTGASISGRVTGPTGQPVADVVVWALQQQVSEGGDLVWDFVGHGGTTDSNGRYTITYLRPGAYRVYFDDFNLRRYAAEYYNDAAAVEVAADVIVQADRDTPNINAQLAKAAGISGRVTGPNGSAAVGVHIAAYQLATDADGDFWQAILYTDSDEQGNYRLSGLLPGSYRVGFAVIDFDLNGAYVAEAYNNAPTLDDGVDLVVTAGQTRSGINAQLDRRPSLGGLVTDAPGTPLPNIAVTLIYSATALDGTRYPLTVSFSSSDEQGIYRFAEILVGAYTVCFGDPNQPPHWRSECYANARTVARATWVTLPANTTRNDINVQLTSTAGNAPPVAVADTLTLFRGTSTSRLESGATSLFANDSDADDDLLGASTVEYPQHGTLTLAADGTFTYTHNGDEATTDRFVYRVTDEVGATATATVTIRIKPPVAIELTKTIWLAGLGNDCRGTSNLRIPVSTTVAYCYTVYNSGIVTLTTHSLVDDQLGTLLANVPYTLAPGLRYHVISTATITAPITNTATWTAAAPALQPITSTATATVTFSAATDDQDDDGIFDKLEGLGDPDQDSLPNFLDPDADGDWVTDRKEWGDNPAAARDSNNDGLPDYLDPLFPYTQRLYLPVIAK